MFSLIEGISTNGDKTSLSIFYVNPSIVIIYSIIFKLLISIQEESLFIDELTWYAEEKKITLGVLVESVRFKG